MEEGHTSKFELREGGGFGGKTGYWKDWDIYCLVTNTYSISEFGLVFCYLEFWDIFGWKLKLLRQINPIFCMLEIVTASTQYHVLSGILLSLVETRWSVELRLLWSEEVQCDFTVRWNEFKEMNKVIEVMSLSAVLLKRLERNNP